MAAQSAEAQARILASLREIVSFFESASVQQHSIDNMNEFLSKNQYQDFLNLVEV
jgi:hypothetical protein